MARKRFLFWLDDGINEERRLISTVKVLKTQRLFARTIRDGIRLLTDLRAGKTDVLSELFPDVVTSLKRGTSGGGDDDIDALKRRLTVLEHALLTGQPRMVAQTPTPAPDMRIEKNKGGAGQKFLSSLSSF